MSEEHNTSETRERKNPSESISRRRVIRSLGAAGTATGIGTLSTTPALAKSQNKRRDGNTTHGIATIDEAKQEKIKRQYDSSEQIRQAVKGSESANKILEKLSEKELITNASVSVLNFNNIIDATYMIPEETVEGVAVTTLLDGSTNEPTAFIMLSKHTVNHYISIYVYPERDKSYAIVVPKNDGEEILVDLPSSPVTTPDDISTSTITPDAPACGSFTICADDELSCHVDQGPVCVTAYYPTYLFECYSCVNACVRVGKLPCLEGCSKQTGLC